MDRKSHKDSVNEIYKGNKGNSKIKTKTYDTRLVLASDFIL